MTRKLSNKRPAIRMRRIKARRAEAGLCEYCGKVPKGATALCEVCRKWAREYAQRKGTEFKRRAVEMFGGVCADCGLKTDILAVYEFHHIDPMTKVFSAVVWRSRCWEKIETELRKCVMLCANCHRIRSVNEQSYTAWRKA